MNGAINLRGRSSLLDNFIGSLKNKFYSLNAVTVYHEKLPKELTIPSMYFPAPITTPISHSKDEYRVNYTINVQIFESNTLKAVKKAEQVATKIRKAKGIVNFVDKEGNVTEDYFIVDSISTQEMAYGIAQVTIDWHYDFNYI